MKEHKKTTHITKSANMHKTQTKNNQTYSKHT